MTMNSNERPEKVEVELTEDALEQVSGGFNPQPDPPGYQRNWKLNQHISVAPEVSLPGAKVEVQKV